MGRAVPIATLERLSTYLNCLIQWERDGEETVSSAGLEARTGISAQQVRKDLSYFGGFGQRGKGYPVRALREAVASILRLQREQAIILVGAGNLGAALLAFPGWQPYNFRIAAVFDNAASKVGHKVRGQIIHPMEALPEAAARLEAQMGILAVPPEAAQDAADAMVNAGIRMILNFAPMSVHVPPGTTVRTVCFMSELAILSYLARTPEAQRGGPDTPRPRNGARMKDGTRGADGRRSENGADSAPGE